MEQFSTVLENLDEYQRIEVQAGIDGGLDVSCYAKPDILAIQMRQIRLGMEEGLDVSVYNKPEYDWFQMEEIRLGMKSGIDYNIYAKPSVNYQRMRQVRKGLEDGIDLSLFMKLEPGVLEELRKALLAKVGIVDFIREGYAVEQLAEIRIALEKKINIAPHISKDFRGASIREICLGLEAGIEVAVYTTPEYDWRQMRELRLGMEARVDVSKYCNSLYSWQQMREIRLGLEEGLDVDQYRKFLYTAQDMERVRKKLLMDEVSDIIERTDTPQTVEDDQVSIFISQDEMEACIQVFAGRELTEDFIYQKLKEHGVTKGILTEEVEALVKNKKYGQTIVVAKGQGSHVGQDGWYEFFFDTNPSRSPHIHEDGTADFKDVKWFEMVKENQKLVYYHEASYGQSGYTVTGKFIKAKKGKEKTVLRGQGFRVEADGKTYTSMLDGHVIYDGNCRLDVSRACVIDDVNLATGNIYYDGTVYVKGNVGSGVMITATESVFVDGYVEAAMIRSGAEIFLRKGANGNGSGILEAKGNVAGQFFEDIKIISGADIIAQYCMNSELHAEGNILLQGRKGLLLGGVSRAARGIVAYCIGNRMGLRTILNVGIDQATLKMQQKNGIEIDNVNRELDILRHSKADFQKKYSPEVRNSMDIYLKIENAIYTKELQMKYLLEEKDNMEQHIADMRGSKVEVAGSLYEGTEITIDNAKWKAFTIKDVIVRCKKDKIVVESK